MNEDNLLLEDCDDPGVVIHEECIVDFLNEVCIECECCLGINWLYTMTDGTILCGDCCEPKELETMKCSDCLNCSIDSLLYTMPSGEQLCEGCVRTHFSLIVDQEAEAEAEYKDRKRKEAKENEQ